MEFLIADIPSSLASSHVSRIRPRGDLVNSRDPIVVDGDMDTVYLYAGNGCHRSPHDPKRPRESGCFACPLSDPELCDWNPVSEWKQRKAK